MSLHAITAVGRDDPAGRVLVPADLLDAGLEADVAIQIELARDRLTVFQDLLAEGIFLLRDEAELFEQGQIGVGLDVAGDPGIAVPIPGKILKRAIIKPHNAAP